MHLMNLVLTVVVLGPGNRAVLDVWSPLVLVPLILFHHQGKFVLLLQVLCLAREGNISVKTFTGHGARDGS